MVRKLAIAAIPVFIKPQPTGSLQGVLGEIVLVLYIFVIAYLRPFASSNDNLLQVGSTIGADLLHKPAAFFLLLFLVTYKSLSWSFANSPPQQHLYLIVHSFSVRTGSNSRDAHQNC